MSSNTGKLLGISITLEPRKKILEKIEKYLVRPSSRTVRPFVIVTPNPEQMVLAKRNSPFARIINKADVAIPDGIGLVWAMRWLGVSKNMRRIPGNELLEDISGIASKRAVRIGLIGGNGNVAVEAAECLKQRLPSLKVEAMGAPEFRVVNNQLATAQKEDFFAKTASWIKEKDIRVLFVGLGAPKQEFFIDRLLTLDALTHDTLILMSVGGSFDILAGRVRRAPFVVRSIGFEWFWRLLAEPWRFRRQLSLVSFAFLVFREKFRSLAK